MQLIGWFKLHNCILISINRKCVKLCLKLNNENLFIQIFVANRWIINQWFICLRIFLFINRKLLHWCNHNNKKYPNGRCLLFDLWIRTLFIGMTLIKNAFEYLKDCQWSFQIYTDPKWPVREENKNKIGSMPFTPLAYTKYIIRTLMRRYQAIEYGV